MVAMFYHPDLEERGIYPVYFTKRDYQSRVGCTWKEAERTSLLPAKLTTHNISRRYIFNGRNITKGMAED